ncbi:hypothetical protein WID27_17960 [Streptomyces sp. F41]|uniref:hypothetical protein n=1 Tax=Streptomyces sp. F41 TaxID=1795888 RepID=UPI0030CB576D
MADKVKWAQYADGETHQLREYEIRYKHGCTMSDFRKRLSMYARRHGRAYTVHKSLGVLHFRIGG